MTKEGGRIPISISRSVHLASLFRKRRRWSAFYGRCRVECGTEYNGRRVYRDRRGVSARRRRGSTPVDDKPLVREKRHVLDGREAGIREPERRLFLGHLQR